MQSISKSFLIVLVVMSVLAVPAFSSGQAEEEDGVTELTIWFGRDNFIPSDAFDAFHEAHPNIRVTTDVVPLENSLSEYVQAYQGGNAPDIFQTNIWNIPTLVNQGSLMDISGLLDQWESDDPEDFSTMAESAWSLASDNGTPYGMALHAMPYLYVYRKDLLDEAGLAPPDTWEDVMDIAEELSNGRLGFALNASASQNPPWFLAKFIAMGGEIPGGIPQLDSEAGIYAVNLYQRMMKEGYIDPDTLAWDSGEMRASFMRGDAVQALIGVNIFPSIQENLTYGTEWGFTAPPARPGAEDQQRVMANAWPYMVSSQPEGKDEAILAALRYLSSHEIVKEVAIRYQPTTRTTVGRDPEYLAQQPWFEDGLEEIFAEMVPIPSHPNSPQAFDIVVDVYQDALSNPDESAAEIVARYQEELDELR